MNSMHSTKSDTFLYSVLRMFNALEPGTEVPIARHRICSETHILLRDKQRVNINNDNKDIIESCVLHKSFGNIGIILKKG